MTIDQLFLCTCVRFCRLVRGSGRQSRRFGNQGSTEEFSLVVLEEIGQAESKRGTRRNRIVCCPLRKKRFSCRDQPWEGAGINGQGGRGMYDSYSVC